MYLLCCRLINDTQVESEEEKHREIWKRAGKNMYIQKKEKKKSRMWKAKGRARTEQAKGN